MKQYTLRMLSEAGELYEVVEDERASDDEAIGRAEASAHPHGIEVWHGCRLIARCPPRSAWGLRLPIS